MSLDGAVIRAALDATTRERLSAFDVFTEIESTNSYLMSQPGPEPGRLAVALTENQTAGRGRLGRTWQTPPGSGLALSMAFTFAVLPRNLPALTLALGLSAIDSLGRHRIDGIDLKWPNDLIARDAKLGGILTETHAKSVRGITVVTGLGLNLDLGSAPNPGGDGVGARPAIDLRSLAGASPDPELIAAGLIDNMSAAFVEFETRGFEHFAARWSEFDWLRGRQVTVELPGREISGVGAGIDQDGALLVDSGHGGVARVTSGTVVAAGARATNP